MQCQNGGFRLKLEENRAWRRCCCGEINKEMK